MPYRKFLWAYIAYASVALATPTYYLSTPQTGAQTQIDSTHTSAWIINAISPFNLAGGIFSMKDGASSVDTVTLSLYQGTSSTGSLLASIVLTNAGFCAQASNCGQYANHTFAFSTAISLQTNLNYYVALTSAAPNSQNSAYFIKSGSPFSSDSQGTATIPNSIGTGVPEPTTFGMLLLGVISAIPTFRKT